MVLRDADPVADRRQGGRQLELGRPVDGDEVAADVGVGRAAGEGLDRLAVVVELAEVDLRSARRGAITVDARPAVVALAEDQVDMSRAGLDGEDPPAEVGQRDDPGRVAGPDDDVLGALQVGQHVDPLEPGAGDVLGRDADVAQATRDRIDERLERRLPHLRLQAETPGDLLGKLDVDAGRLAVFVEEAHPARPQVGTIGEATRRDELGLEAEGRRAGRCGRARRGRRGRAGRSRRIARRAAAGGCRRRRLGDRRIRRRGSAAIGDQHHQHHQQHQQRHVEPRARGRGPTLSHCARPPLAHRLTPAGVWRSAPRRHHLATCTAARVG